MINNITEAQFVIDRAIEALNINRYDLILAAWLLKSDRAYSKRATQAVYIHYRGTPEDLKPLYLAFLMRTKTSPPMMDLEEEIKFYSKRINKLTLMLQRYYKKPHKFSFVYPYKLALISTKRGPRIKVFKKRKHILYKPYELHHLLGMIYAFGHDYNLTKNAYKTLKQATNLTPRGILFDASRKHGKKYLQRL